MKLKLPSDPFIDELINETYLTKTGVALAICHFSIELQKLNPVPLKPFFNEWWMYCFINSSGEWITCTVDRETFIDTPLFLWSKKGIRYGHCIYTQIPWLEYVRDGREPKDCLIKLGDYK